MKHRPSVVFLGITGNSRLWNVVALIFTHVPVEHKLLNTHILHCGTSPTGRICTELSSCLSSSSPPHWSLAASELTSLTFCTSFLPMSVILKSHFGAAAAVKQYHSQPLNDLGWFIRSSIRFICCASLCCGLLWMLTPHFCVFEGFLLYFFPCVHAKQCKSVILCKQLCK